jgi:hypothetical protein
MKKIEINFETTKQETRLINQIVTRYFRGANERHLDFDRIAVTLDLKATNANGCPIDFKKLLESDDFTFFHDVYQIVRYLDRETGKLTNNFLPRCSKSKQCKEISKQ